MFMYTIPLNAHNNPERGYYFYHMNRKLRIKEFKELAKIYIQRYLILDFILLITICLSPHN